MTVPRSALTLNRSQDAFRRGDKATAKQLSDAAKKEFESMKAANAKAAEAQFEFLNASRADDVIDLHGLHVDEAIAKLRSRIHRCRERRLPSLTVIVGVGNHSVNNIAKLKPVVTKFLADNELFAIPDNPNPGCIFIDFSVKPSTGFYCIIL